MLIRGLPPDSATRARIDNGPDAGPPFTLLNHQLADVYDVLSTANWQRANEGVPEHKVSRRPKPYPRPGDIRASRERAADRAKALAALRERAAKRKELIAAGVIR